MSADLQPLLLDALLAGGLLLIIVVDLVLTDARKALTGDLTFVLLAGLFAASFAVDTSGPAFNGAYVGGPWALFFKRVFLAAGAITALGAREYVAVRFPRRQGEFYVLLLASLLGMTLLPGARNLVLLLVAFELMSLPLAALAAYTKTEAPSPPDAAAPEGALKLYLVGAASTALTIFGMSLVFGTSGHLDLEGIASAAAHPSPLFLVGMAMVLAGFGFKIGAVPFHFWVPDTYQSAPTPFVAFLSVAPKAAGFAALCALFQPLFAPALLAAAALTLVVGNLLAIPQSNVKRLLAFSGVAHIGYMLVALALGTTQGVAVVLFYLAGYVATNLGAFLLVGAVGGRDADVSITAFDGLGRRSPGLAATLLVFLLSLAGIPFVVGFWAKLYVFVEAWRGGTMGFRGVVILGALMAVVGLWYYMQIAYAAYMKPPAEGRSGAIAVDFRTRVALAVCLILVVGMGVVPGAWLEAATVAARGFGR